MRARAPIADPQHQRGFAAMHCHDWVRGENKLGLRSRETDKGQPSQEYTRRDIKHLAGCLAEIERKIAGKESAI